MQETEEGEGRKDTESEGRIRCLLEREKKREKVERERQQEGGRR